MVELRPKKDQKHPKERVRGHGETSVDVSDEQDALVTLGHGLNLARVWLPPPIRRDEPFLGDFLQPPHHDT
jgi:hypothetical protein